MNAVHAWMKARMARALTGRRQEPRHQPEHDPELGHAIDPGGVEELVGHARDRVLAHEEDAEAEDQERQDQADAVLTSLRSFIWRNSGTM